MVEQKKGVALRTYVPLAIIHGKQGDIRRLRYVDCTIRCADALLQTGKMVERRSTKLLSEVASIHITGIEKMQVKEILWSGENAVQHQNAIARMMPIKGSNYAVYGTRVITYVNEDTGEVANGGVCYALISHAEDIDFATQRTMYYTEVHGFWDYTGAWHAGIADIPKRNAYMTELQIMQQQGFDKAVELSLVRPAAGDVETLLPLASLAREDTRVLLCIPEDMSRGAATALLASDMQTMLADCGTVCTIDRNVNRPFVQLPASVQELVVSPRTRPLTVNLSPNLKVLCVTTESEVNLIGLEQLTLRTYYNESACVTKFALPHAVARDIRGITSALSFRPKKVAPFIGEQLNLHAICRDSYGVNLDLPGQPWNKVILPLGDTLVRYAGLVTRTQFDCIVLPCIFERKKANDNINGGNVEMLYNFTENEVARKTVNIDLRNVLLNDSVIIVVQAGAVDRRNVADYDGTRNVVNLYTDRWHYGRMHLNYTTDCTITDNIFAVNTLPTLYCMLRGVALNAGESMTTGKMTVMGNVHELVVAVDVSEGTRAVKGIYINGCVDILRIMELRKADQPECEAKLGVHIHLKKGTPMPKLGVTVDGHKDVMRTQLFLLDYIDANTAAKVAEQRTGCALDAAHIRAKVQIDYMN